MMKKSLTIAEALQFFDVIEDEILSDEASSSEEDILTEVSEEEELISGDEVLESQPSSNFFVGKDKIMWTKTCPRVNMSHKKHNIVSGVRPSTTEAKAMQLFDVLEDEILSDEASSSEEDILTQVSEEEELISGDEILESKPLSDFSVGNDKTMWNKTCPTLNAHNKKQSIVFGVRPSAQNQKSILDAWGLYFSDSFIDKIVYNTNLYIEKQQVKFARERDCKFTTGCELKAVFGLLYLAGVMKSSHQNLSDLWEDDGTGVDVFRATMTLKRFRFLLKTIRFEDFNSRKQRRVLDKLSPIREIFSEFVASCQKHFIVSEYVTVDEMLEKFQGRCPFKVYMKSKPAKYGIKIYALVDARTFYVSTMEIYAGQQPQGPFSLSYAPSDVVKRLVMPISGTGRNVTMNSYFSSIPLAESLLEEHNLTVIGTLQKSKREIPQDFLPSEKRDVYSSVFGFHKNLTLVSYVPEKNKCVVLISSLHHDSAVDKTPEKKPEIINLYNITKGGVDVVDEMKGSYSVARNSRRWPMTIFFSMMNIAGINSQIIYQSNTKHKLSRRKYLKQLGLELVNSHVNERKKNPCLPSALKRKIEAFCGEDIKRPRRNKIGRCYICSSRKNRKTKQMCRDCDGYICREHTTFFCVHCVKVQNFVTETD